MTRWKRAKGDVNQPIISSNSDDEQLRVEIDQKKYLQIVKNLINYILTLFGIGDGLKANFIKR